MCDQYGHMIRAAENRDERTLAQVLTNGLAQHRAKHASQPRRLEAVPQPDKEEGEDG
ncbi:MULTISPECIES: hypothetical protein [unclassified Streptomyces]|uniref:hypothetical protein n=1 Tax=unclassified Streptomyces TaxID=2593676 RepID=UPI002DD7BB96|nr:MULTISPECIES: hypothetical protein [unclassified Streptomyces]WSS46753.1 hypothetical protein OG220_39925 [Streptomyces sp. NBC_01187]WSA97730.1 hypothetical protein OIE63_40295 [Streptomyces sp. NBC_01795]WSB82020.1 hypothetical protein OHB04_40525 [Streptomyces sp. NBC_01775]WSS17995.1 hypothetical protein OG533_39630 [Streptomyces sp. NBC_01186]WSS47030.1 hypothetical protein OG220_41700 [Streptomyces sp. NBC_01187]